MPETTWKCENCGFEKNTGHYCGMCGAVKIERKESRMQKLACEMCGGNDIVKENGLYVCQHCGTKYTVEEAKQLFINGTVKIDYSQKLENLYVLARRAIDEKDFKAAQRYYEDILLEHPEKWEPVFHAAYFKIMNHCENDDVIDSVQYISNKLNTTFVLLEKDKVENHDESARLIATDVILLEHRLFEIILDKFYNIDFETRDRDDKRIYVESIKSLYGLLKELASYLDNYNETETIKIKFDIKKQGVRLLVILKSDVAGIDKEWVIRHLKEDCVEILAYDRDPDTEYVLSTLSDTSEQGKATNEIVVKEEKKKGSCFIATAVYGSYDCPQVWVLRRFRDEVLMPMMCGKVFVKTYYMLSPKLLRLVGDTKLFHNICVKILDKFVCYLKGKGFSDNPYEDNSMR